MKWYFKIYKYFKLQVQVFVKSKTASLEQVKSFVFIKTNNNHGGSM